MIRDHHPFKGAARGDPLDIFTNWGGLRGYFLGFGRFWGGHAPGIADAWISRPPKSRFFKTDQTPLELGKGKGRGKHEGRYRGVGNGV